MSAARSAGACRASTSPTTRATSKPWCGWRGATSVTVVAARQQRFHRHAFRRLRRLPAAMGRRGRRRRRHLQLARQVGDGDATSLSGSFGSPADALTLFGGRLGDGAHHRLRHDSREGRLGGEQLLHALCDLRRRASDAWTSRAPRCHADRQRGDAARHRRARAVHGQRRSEEPVRLWLRGRCRRRFLPDGQSVRARSSTNTCSSRTSTA